LRGPRRREPLFARGSVGIADALRIGIMSEPRKLRCYEYVNRPYERVRALLRDRGHELFQHATSTAASRADSLVSTLRVGVGGIEIGVDAKIQIRGTRDEDWIAGLSPVTRMTLGWEAARATALFPSMEAELSAWPLYATETQLEIEGRYTPPLGIVGNAVDAIVGHRLAEATVHRFLEDIVEEIRRELPTR
jgi:hypothetical protein